MTTPCVIVGCEGPHYAKGYCRRHYRQASENKGGLRIGVACKECSTPIGHLRADRLFCSIACQMRWHRREGCYTQARLAATMPACSISGCEKPSKINGLCNVHAKRVWKHGDPSISLIKRSDFAECVFDGCSEVGRWKGLCKKHYDAKFRAENHAYFLAHNAGRRHQMRAWQWDAHRDEIKAIYEQSARRSAETGILHHVDHVVPLKGKSVCGLHVPWNLEIIPAIKNRRKHNHLEIGGGADGAPPAWLVPMPAASGAVPEIQPPGETP